MDQYVRTPLKRALGALTPYANKYFPPKTVDEADPETKKLRQAQKNAPLSLDPLLDVSGRLTEASSLFLFVIFVGVYLALDLSTTRVFEWLNGWSTLAATQQLQNATGAEKLAAAHAIANVPLASTLSFMLYWGVLPAGHTMNQRYVFLPAQVTATLASYGPWGRFLYGVATMIEMGGGIALGAILGMLFTFMISESKGFQRTVQLYLVKAPRSVADLVRVLLPCVNVVPLFYSLALLAENTLLLWIVWFYPSVSGLVSALAALFSAIKWTLFLLCFSVVLLRLPWVLLSWWTLVGRDGRQRIPPTPAKTPFKKPLPVEHGSPLRSRTGTARKSFFE